MDLLHELYGVCSRTSRDHLLEGLLLFTGRPDFGCSSRALSSYTEPGAPRSILSGVTSKGLRITNV